MRSIETVEAAMRPIAASSLRWPPTHFEGSRAAKEDTTAEPWRSMSCHLFKVEVCIFLVRKRGRRKGKGREEGGRGGEGKG